MSAGSCTSTSIISSYGSSGSSISLRRLCSSRAVSALDELFEILTLVQTRKMRKRIPIVLFGTEYWDDIIDFGAMVKYGVISPGDVELFHRINSVDDAYEVIIKGLTENALGTPGPVL